MQLAESPCRASLVTRRPKRSSRRQTCPITIYRHLQKLGSRFLARSSDIAIDHTDA